MSSADNLYPIFDRVLTRTEKEVRLGQRGRVIWLFGLSGSGKSTLAVALERRLAAEGRVTQLLDGDNVRTGLNRNLGFTDADRDENSSAGRSNWAATSRMMKIASCSS